LQADREFQVAALIASLADGMSSQLIEQQLNMPVWQPCSSIALLLKRNPASSFDLLLCFLAADFKLASQKRPSCSHSYDICLCNLQCIMGHCAVVWLHPKLAIDSQKTRLMC